MEIVNRVLFLLIALVVTACVSERGVDSFPIRRLEKGSYGGVVERRQVVIKDKTDWERLWGAHQAQSQPPRPIPEIDFAREMVIFVAMGQQFTGGFAIEIEKVEAARRRLRIAFRRKAPPSGAMVSQALSAPFEIVAVPKSNLPTEFVEIKDEARE